MKRYLPIKRIVDLLQEIKKEDNYMPQTTERDICEICNKKDGDMYLLKKRNNCFFVFKIKIRFHRIEGSPPKFVKLCDGCHLKYHLFEHCQE